MNFDLLTFGMVAGNLVLCIVLLRKSNDGRSQALGEEQVRSALDRAREESSGAARALREEVVGQTQAVGEMVCSSVGRLGEAQQRQIEVMLKQVQSTSELSGQHLERIRVTLNDRVRELQLGNEEKLEQMRQVVDEKLQRTLERRLGESFRLVGERLEAVHRGLGEMRTLAVGVGDLKRVLTNVKARGTWGEVQLGALLAEVLTPDQYDCNVATRRGSSARVEYAIRLPGKESGDESSIWLPIDSKFPQEDYLKILDASDAADSEGLELARKALVGAVRRSASDIAEKYLDPPNTTDFALLFLPTEGLYAEVLRQPGVVEDLQSSFRVCVAGPTTLLAQLSSLRMGFRTLAIEQRSSEVWKVLGAVKTEFAKFGAVLGKLKKQLGAAANTIDSTEVRTRAMERKLREVEELPQTEAKALLDVGNNIPDSLSPELNDEGENAAA